VTDFDRDLFHRLGHRLYADAPSDRQIIFAMASDLHTPAETVRRWWLGRKDVRIPGPVFVALALLLLRRKLASDDDPDIAAIVS